MLKRYFQTWNEFIEMSEEQQLAAIDYRPTLRNDDHNEQLSKGFVNVTVSEQGIVQEEDNFKHDKRNGKNCCTQSQAVLQYHDVALIYATELWVNHS